MTSDIVQLMNSTTWPYKNNQQLVTMLEFP